jgi:hypothetical protein
MGEITNDPWLHYYDKETIFRICKQGVFRCSSIQYEVGYSVLLYPAFQILRRTLDGSPVL